MKIRVLGSAAGGGFPQWNSAGPACLRARRGDPAARPRTQCSLAVSDDGENWVLLDAAPDIAAQIGGTPELHPRTAPRSSPISAVVLTGADVDHIAGLLSLRERHAFTLYASGRVQDVLRRNPVFDVLAPDVVKRETVALEQPFTVRNAAGEPTGIEIVMFAVPGKQPLYMEQAGDATGMAGTEPDDVVGLELRDRVGGGFFHIPGCAAVTPDLRQRLRDAALVFFDGTLWQDDEMIRAGIGMKSGRRMGHVSVSGDDGSLAALAGLNIARKVYIHINNTNPLLLDDSPQRAEVEAAGWSVAHDGMEIVA